MTATARGNNFDIIRLVAAIMVIYSHGFGFADLMDPLIAINHQVHWGREGVYVFFLISGYLISKSWIKTPDLRVYFTNRILRIYPGLIAVVLICMFIIGPVFTQLSLKAYFSNIGVYKYILNISLAKLVSTLPQVFIIKGQPNTVNSPLWTLVYEFLMYIIVAAYGLTGLLKPGSKKFIVFILVYVFFLIYTLDSSHGNFSILNVIIVKSFSLFYLYFFAGVFFNFYQDKIKLQIWYIIPLAILWYFSIDTFLFTIANLLITGFVIFYISFLPQKLGAIITKHGDFSYGFYLYGYIVQNMVTAVIGYTMVYPSTLLSIVLTIPFALFSWYAIESRALKLENAPPD